MPRIIQYGTSFNNNFPINNNVVFNNNTLYSINDVTVDTNLTPRVVIDYTSNYYIDGKGTSLSDLNISSIGNTDFLNKVVLSFDKTNLNNYARFGNLNDLMVSCIQGIILTYPASLYVTYFSDGRVYDNVFDYNYNPINKIASFKVNAFLISNSYSLNYVKSNNTNQSVYTSSSTEYNVIKDLTLSYNDYELYYIDPNTNVEKTYPLVGFTGSTSNGNGYISVNIMGDGFEVFSASTFSYNFHIRPNGIKFNTFYNTLNTLQKYLLNQEKYNKNTSLFKTIEEDIDGNVSFVDNKYTWPTSDGYNLDYDTPSYSIYFNNLINISQSYDKLKSNLILRFLSPQSLVDYDASVDDRIGKLLKIYGREFDEIKSFIDGIVYVNKVSYDGVENIPNIWIKNLAASLGWETFNIVDSNDFINDILTPNLNDGVSKTDTPYEVDIELWRRIIINTNWFFKNKGTRKAIETIFSFVGAPECLVDFNEHVYTVSGKIDINTVDQTLIDSYGFTRLPYDTNGNPKAPNETNDFNFQVAGDNDMGQTYINLYRQLGFDVTKTIDNKKSWEYYSGNTRRSYDVFATDYTQESNELIINTKEVSINLDLAQAIECDVYSFNYDHNYPVTNNYDDRGYPYPNRKTNIIDVQQLSFAEYIQTVYSKFINAQNHKIIDDARGGGYPTLYKLYSDYLTNSLADTGYQSNERNIGFMLEYIKSIGGIFDRFIKQLIPATTIFDGLGEKYRNTIFTPQKFVYQAGIDAGSEFQTNQNAFNKNDEFNIVKITGSVTVPTNGSINTYTSLGNYQYSPDGNLTDIDNEYFIKIDRVLNFWNNQHWDSNQCYLDIPQYFVNGAVKIEPDEDVYCISKVDFIYNYLNVPLNLYLSCLIIPSGYTSISQVFYEEYYNAVHYYDVEPFKELEFVFTSKTDIDMFTSNTINFGYTVNKYNKNTFGFDDTIIYDKILTNYTIYSSNTLVFRDEIDNSYLSRDAEYLLKSYFSKNCDLNQFEPYSGVTSPYNSYENFNFIDYGNQYPSSLNHFTPSKSIYNSTGFTINTRFDYNVVNNLPYTYYDIEFDYYFSSVGTPDKPTLAISSNITPNDNSGLRYVVEQIPIDAIGMTAFTTTYNPKNDLQLTFNGLVLTPNIEYYKDSLNISNLNKRYVMTNPIMYSTDIIVASYLTDDLNSSNIVFDCEDYYVSSITSNGTGVSNSVKFAYNTGTTKYEYYLNSGITNVNNINFVINGSTMTNGVDFTISMFDNRKIILNVSPIIIGDEFNVCYTQVMLVDDVYLIPSNPYDFSWSITNPTPVNEIGYFTQEFYGKNDLSLSTIIYSSTTNYIPLTTNYSQSINFLSASTLNYGEQYRYRVKSQRYFSALTGNNLEIDNYSDVVVIEIPS